MRRLAPLALILGLGASPAIAQTVDRTKAETVAAGQATEADRLFKAREFEAALPIYEAERASRAALGDVRYEAYALRAIGLCRAELGDDPAAIESYKLARVLDLKREDKGYAGYDDFLTAEAFIRLNRPLDAIEALKRAFPMLSEAVDRDHEADARLVMARTLITLGRAEEARPHADRALALAADLGDDFRKADAHASIGQVDASLGKHPAALDHFAEAQKAFDRQGRAAEAAWMETVSASTLVLMGKPESALARFEAAAKLHAHLDDDASLAEDLTAISGLQLEAGRLKSAEEAATRAVDASRNADDREREVEARIRLAQVQGAKGDWPTASETIDEAVLLIRQVARGNPAEQIRVLLAAAGVDQRAKREDRARQRLDAARKLADDSGLAPLKEVVAETTRRLASPDGPK